MGATAPAQAVTGHIGRSIERGTVVIVVVAILAAIGGLATGFMGAAFIAARGRPCPYCANRESHVPYKVEPADRIIREALGQ